MAYTSHKSVSSDFDHVVETAIDPQQLVGIAENEALDRAAKELESPSEA